LPAEQKYLTNEKEFVLNDLGLLTKNVKPEFEVGEPHHGACSCVDFKSRRKSGILEF